MDWGTTTKTWVREGLITADQAPALKRWLDRHGPRQPRWDGALTVLAMAGAWLLTGTGAALVLELGGTGDEARLAGFISALLWIIVGFGLGRVASEAAGQGLVGAGVVAATLALVPVKEIRNLDLMGLLLVLTPAFLGTVLAGLQRQGGLAAASSLAFALVMVPLLIDGGVGEWAFGGTLAYAALVNLLVYEARQRGVERTFAQAMQSQIGFLTLVMVFASFEIWGFGRPRKWTAGSALLGAGAMLLGAGALGQSRMTLVSGLVVLVIAEIRILEAIGDVRLAIAILGLEGLALIVAVVGVLVSRAGKARRDQAKG
ncbi:MAG: hypothetical protein AAGA48_10690 [Myxococcota bacterium]